MADYIKWKTKILRQLGINLTPEQKEHMKTLQNEIQVDNFAHDLIFGKDGAPYGDEPDLCFRPRRTYAVQFS